MAARGPDLYSHLLLQILFITENRLAKVPKDFLNLSNLRNCSLGYNKFRSLPKQIIGRRVPCPMSWRCRGSRVVC